MHGRTLWFVLRWSLAATLLLVFVGYEAVKDYRNSPAYLVNQAPDQWCERLYGRIGQAAVDDCVLRDMLRNEPQADDKLDDTANRKLER